MGNLQKSGYFGQGKRTKVITLRTGARSRPEEYRRPKHIVGQILNACPGRP
jgi:hypothetical protein